MNLLALSSLFLADSTVIGLGVGLGVGVLAALVIGFFVGYIINQKRTDKRLGDVETRTKKMIDDASLECKTLKKEAILEAKEQELQLRNELSAKRARRRTSLQSLNKDLCRERKFSKKGRRSFKTDYCARAAASRVGEERA